MEDNILVKQSKMWSCVEGCLINVCVHYKRDYHVLFLHSWDFGIREEKVFEESFHFSSLFHSIIDEYFCLASEYLNIEIVPIENSYTMIGSRLNNNKIIYVNSDAFCLPWNLAYRKKHIFHSYLLMRKSFAGDLIVIDPFCSAEIINISNIEELHILSCYEIYEKENKCLNICDLQKEYIEYLENIYKRKFYESIKIFGEKLLEIRAIEELTRDYNDLENNNFLRRIYQILNARYNTKLLFEYLLIKKEYVENMEVICARWERVKNVFIKTIITKKLDLLKKISDEVLTISNLEKQLCEELIKGRDIYV